MSNGASSSRFSGLRSACTTPHACSAVTAPCRAAPPGLKASGSRYRDAARMQRYHRALHDGPLLWSHDDTGPT